MLFDIFKLGFSKILWGKRKIDNSLFFIELKFV